MTTPTDPSLYEDSMDHLTDQLFEAVKQDARDLATMLPQDREVAGRLLVQALPVLFREIEMARRDKDRLRTALEFYADMSLWDRAYIGGGFADSVAAEDGGETARLALREK